jgi:hypothetical protein
MIMEKTVLGIVVMAGVISMAVAVFGQTNLTVVRHADNTLWKMTCDGISDCSAWTKISGKFSVQPTLTWDAGMQKYILIGIGNDKTSIWRGTFEADGTWNDDWTLIAGTSPSPVAVAAGKVKGYFRNVAVVAATGGDYTNPAAAMAAYATWCGTPSETNPCLLKIMPGVYDIGASPVVMQAYIDIEGSGEKTTKIIGAISNGAVLTNGTINGASNAEIRFLTVENTGIGIDTVALLNSSASTSILHVTARASGGAFNYGVFNNSSSPVMTNVTACGSGGNYSYGVYNDSSSPVMTNVTASASGGGAGSYGVVSASAGTVKINHSVISGISGTISIGPGATNRVAYTQLDGGAVHNNGGTLTCVGAYDGNYLALDTTCQ